MSIASDWAVLVAQNRDAIASVEAQAPAGLTLGNAVFSVTGDGGLHLGTAADLSVDETATLIAWLQVTFE